MRIYPERPEKAYFFGTCLVDALYPETGLAAVRLLKREGLQVIFPHEQSCCGQPAFNSGFPEEARAVARKQLKAFSQPWHIVVPSGSCAAMMRRHYPELFAGTSLAGQAVRFAERVFEISEYLVHVLGMKPVDRGAPVTVAWHSSCHALREMGVTEDSKSLIRALKNVTLKELEREDECCGFGGVFSVKQPALSAAITADKVADIRKTGASRMITGDCGCLMNIAGAMDRSGPPVQSQHIAEFLWERIHG